MGKHHCPWDMFSIFLIFEGPTPTEWGPPVCHNWLCTNVCGRVFYIIVQLNLSTKLKSIGKIHSVGKSVTL